LGNWFLQDLANPYVNPHLEYYPVDSGGIDVYKFSQSFKWREGLNRELRAQMVAIRNKHFYIYEPCQLVTGTLVVPIFFYSYMGKMFSKCIKPNTRGLPHEKDFKIFIPRDIQYQSANLLSVDCEDFALMYSEVRMWGDRTLSDVCRGKIYGEPQKVFAQIR
jgi:hypothetical protein